MVYLGLTGMIEVVAHWGMLQSHRGGNAAKPPRRMVIYISLINYVVQAVPQSHIDNEYANATEKDAKIFLTISRDLSAPLTGFVKELKSVFPNTRRMNRGSQVVSEIIETAWSHAYTEVIFVTKNRGKPEQYPHVIFDNFTSHMGKRVASMLKHMFPVDARCIITNKSDYISFRNHVYDKGEGGPKSIELKEDGPRFELRVYQVLCGTMELEEAEMEWVSWTTLEKSLTNYVLTLC
ncbi:PREDICTED: brix domain-containing protein ZK795.3-like [Brassica oleracea var. oleracea]|uniref:brix domain-containing protein ZK795.3-like n=1 Tax=Brassica oleracea var. oleracea TaxID=109376 RepID=UPI0006A7053C|nr:PREDICTED: brix domain-containing protein ZK795.3-like [Brassica oleracea var. oleracea]